MRQVTMTIAALLLFGPFLTSCKKDDISLTPYQPKRSPVANAGADITIVFPTDSAQLIGSAADADGQIIAYKWRKISGPDSVTIVDSKAAATAIKSLVPGYYQFELNVTDNDNLTSSDTIKVTVRIDRPEIHLNVTPFSMLLPYAEGRTVTAAGNKLLFAGGYSGSTIFTTVFIYDTQSGTWSLGQLSEPRAGVVAAVVGNKVFFAGGATKYELTWDDAVWTSPSKRIDVYDASSDSWSTAELPEARSFLHAAVSGNKIFFGGGSTVDSGRVDIFDVSSNSWSIVALDPPRAQMAVASTGDQLFFAGGLSSYGLPLSELDILHLSNNIMILETLSTPWYNNVAVVSGTSVFLTGINIHAGFTYNQVDIYDAATQSKFTNYLAGDYVFGGISLGDITLLNEGSQLEIYNANSQEWTVAKLPQGVSFSDIVTLGGKIYATKGTQIWEVGF